MDEIRELMGRLGELSDEEFGKLRDLVKAQAAEIKDDDPSNETTALLVELGELTDSIIAETQARETKAQETAEARQAAREKIKALGGEEESEAEEGEPEAQEAEAEEEQEPATAEEEASEEAPEPVAASRGVPKAARPARQP